MEKKTSFILIIITIIAVIAIITYFKNPSSNIDEQTIKCIASKSQLYVSKTCSHCEQQKEILGEYISLFDVTDCIDELDKCDEILIKVIPTWVINEKQYTGVKSLKELKSLAEC